MTFIQLCFELKIKPLYGSLIIIGITNEWLLVPVIVFRSTHLKG